MAIRSFFVGQRLLRCRYASRVATIAQDNYPRSLFRYASVARRILCVLRELRVSILSRFRSMHCRHAGNGTANRHKRCVVLVLDHTDLTFPVHQWTITTSLNGVRGQCTHASNWQPVEREFVVRDRTKRSTRVVLRRAFAALISIQSRPGDLGRSPLQSSAQCQNRPSSLNSSTQHLT